MEQNRKGISLRDVWTTERIRFGGETVRLTNQHKLDCLGVFDFLYLFALRRVVPWPPSFSNKCGSQKKKSALDKGIYLTVRGAQKMQHGGFEWRGYFGRWSMVDALKPRGAKVAWFDSKDHSWWDRFRLQTGLLFDPRFQLKSPGQFQTNENLPATFNYRRGASFRLAYSDKNCD